MQQYMKEHSNVDNKDVLWFMHIISYCVKLTMYIRNSIACGTVPLSSKWLVWRTVVKYVIGVYTTGVYFIGAPQAAIHVWIKWGGGRQPLQSTTKFSTPKSCNTAAFANTKYKHINIEF